MLNGWCGGFLRFISCKANALKMSRFNVLKIMNFNLFFISDSSILSDFGSVSGLNSMFKIWI
jgi:hypothetical protein